MRVRPPTDINAGMPDPITAFVQAGVTAVRRAIVELLRPIENVREETAHDVAATVRALQTDALLLPVLVEHLTLLNTQVAELNAILRPLSEAERGIAVVQNKLTHGLFHHNHNSAVAAEPLLPDELHPPG